MVCVIARSGLASTSAPESHQTYFRASARSRPLAGSGRRPRGLPGARRSIAAGAGIAQWCPIRCAPATRRAASNCSTRARVTPSRDANCETDRNGGLPPTAGSTADQAEHLDSLDDRPQLRRTPMDGFLGVGGRARLPALRGRQIRPILRGDRETGRRHDPRQDRNQRAAAGRLDDGRLEGMPMSAMKRLFQLMADKKASDIFLSVGSPINIKISGVSLPVNQQPMDANTVRGLLYEVIDDKQRKEYEDALELNTAYTLQGVGSFRISAFRQKGSPAVVVRYIPGTIPPLDTLGLPPVLKDLVLEKRGLILMVGATGAGKSTTLAAMLDFCNEQRTGHILTLEDPVEFIFQNKKSIVNQREVGTDTLDMKVGLKNADRKSPDCIMIGEVRDRETMTSAIQYAQSGHLCLATLHANNSYHAMNRIISFYPLESRAALLQDVSP